MSQPHSPEEVVQPEPSLRSVLDHAPVCIWDEDFSEVAVEMDALRAAGVTDLHAYLKERPSEVLRLASLVRVRYVNEESVRSFGLPSVIDFPRDLAAGLTGEMTDAFRDLLVALWDGGTRFDCEARYADAQGNWRHVWSVIAVAPDLERPLDSVIVTFADSTERKRAEEVLRQSAEQFSVLVGTSMDGFLAILPDGRLAEANDALCRMLGFTREELLARTVADLDALQTPDDLVAVMESVRDSGHRRFETKMRRKDGSTFDAEISTVMMPGGDRFIAFARDVSERKRAEETLRRSAEQFAAVAGTSMDGFWMIGLDGRISEANDAVCALLGYTRDELLGQTIAQVEAAESPAQVREHIDLILHAGPQRFETRLRRKDGSEADVEISTVLMPGGDRYVAFVRDVSARKRAEDALRAERSVTDAVLNSVPGLLYLYDETGLLVRWNKNDETMTGYSADELGRMHWWDWFEGDPASLDAAGQALARVSEGGYEEVEVLLKLKDGRRVPYLLTGVGLSIDGRSHLVGVGLDISKRKRAEESLRESEERYRSLVDLCPDAIIVHADGVLLYANPAALALLGASSADELIGTAMLERVHPAWRAVVADRVRDMAAGHYAPPLAEEFLRLDGTPVDVDVVASPFTFEGRRATLVVARDVTERRGAEEALQAQRVFTDAVMDSVPGLLYLYDSDGYLVRWNRAHQEVTGYSADELAGMHVLDWYKGDEDAIAAITAGVQRALVEGYAWAEARLTTKSGKRIPFHFTAVRLEIEGRTYFTGVGIDITERKQAEEALRQSERDLAAAEALAHLGSWNWDLQSNTVRWSAEMYRIYGLDPAAVTDPLSEVARVIHPDDRGRNAAAIEAVASGLGIEPFEYRVLRPDGETRTVLVWGADVERDAEGKPLRASGAAMDVTERKRAEDALLDANRRLEQALADLTAAQQTVVRQERLRALGQMASGIAHDFNNLLTPILGYSEMLAELHEALVDGTTVRRYAQSIGRAAEDARHVVFRLRGFYRHREEAEVFLPVRVNELIEQAASLARPRWKDQAQAAGVTIELRQELSETPVLYGNGAELREALINLIINAADAIMQRVEAQAGGERRADGRIVVRSSALARTAEAPASVVVSVCDTGMGMTEETRRRCLEPFYSTKGERGTGLGLATVYGTVERHEGAIDIQSTWGQGTSIAIRLPVRQPAAGPTQAREPGAAVQALRILVVDDEPAVRGVTTAYLAADGHRVDQAANGREGLERANSAPYDLVITDRAMPEMNGDQLARALKLLDANRPVILLTGFGDMMDSVGERPEAIDVVLGKPFTRAALRDALVRAIASRGGPRR